MLKRRTRPASSYQQSLWSSWYDTALEFQRLRVRIPNYTVLIHIRIYSSVLFSIYGFLNLFEPLLAKTQAVTSDRKVYTHLLKAIPFNSSILFRSSTVIPASTFTWHFSLSNFNKQETNKHQHKRSFIKGWTNKILLFFSWCSMFLS